MSGYASVPIRTCEACEKVGVMFTVQLNQDDKMVLCSDCREVVLALRPHPSPPWDKDRIAQHFGWVDGIPGCTESPCPLHGWEVPRCPDLQQDPEGVGDPHRCGLTAGHLGPHQTAETKE